MAQGINVITVVGDAMARPLLDELERAPVESLTLPAFSSGGAALSDGTKEQINRLLPNVIVIDAFGSSETGVAGSTSSAGTSKGAARFTVDDRTAVLDDDLRPVEPGSGKVGRLARRGHVPLGYYKDEAKTAATFRTEGERPALGATRRHGDRGGRRQGGAPRSGPGCINTGGEKVFAEEVETAARP